MSPCPCHGVPAIAEEKRAYYSHCLQKQGTAAAHQGVLRTNSRLPKASSACLRPPSIYGNHVFRFYYGIKFASAKRQNIALISFSYEGERANISNSVAPWDLGESQLLNYPALFPESQTQATVLVNVATGPETTLLASPPQSGTVMSGFSLSQRGRGRG